MPPSNDIVIQSENLTRRFGPIVAVDNLDLAIRRGEIFGLVGPDGVGKTTTLRLLASVMAPSQGRVTIAGCDTIRQAEALKARIGYMPQQFSLYGDLSVRENLAFFADMFGVRGRERQERSERLLRFARLSQFAGRRAAHLSGGMKKKLALACALIHQPEILLLDEPTIGVDPVSRREFWDILTELHIEGVTILVSTPYMDEAERCSRVGLMIAGRIVVCDTPEGVKNLISEELIEVRPAGQGSEVDALHQAQAALSDLPGVQEMQVYGDRLHLFVPDAARLMPDVAARLAAAGLRAESLRQTQPRMEEAFISLVHRQQNGDHPQKPALDPQNRTRPTAIPAEPASPAQSRRHCVAGFPVPGAELDQRPAVEARGLTRQFGHFTAVDQISFSVPRGQIYGFLGPNGAGKTTTIRMLLGLIAPSDGSASVLGLDIVRDSAAIRRRVGYMSQKFSLYNDLTVAENLNLFGGIYGVRGRRLQQRKQAILSMAGLEGRERERTANLSGGWKQRLALGAALIHEPEMLFLDEPTAGVDPISRRAFWQLLYELAAGGATILVTTHYMDEAEQCHRLAFIQQGRLVAMGSPQEVKLREMAGQVLEVDCDRPDRAVSVLRQLGCFDEVALYGALLHVVTRDLAGGRTAIEQALAGQGIRVRRIDPIAPSLEDVFIATARRSER